MNQKNLNISSCRSGYGMTDQGKNKSLHELQTTDWHLEELKKKQERAEMKWCFTSMTTYICTYDVAPHHLKLCYVSREETVRHTTMFLLSDIFDIYWQVSICQWFDACCLGYEDCSGEYICLISLPVVATPLLVIHSLDIKTLSLSLLSLFRVLMWAFKDQVRLESHQLSNI